MHNKLMRARKKLAARSTYPFYRSALELLETNVRWKEERALRDLYDKTDGENWRENNGWNTVRSMRDGHT